MKLVRVGLCSLTQIAASSLAIAPALLLPYQPVLKAPEGQGPLLILQNNDGIGRRSPVPMRRSISLMPSLRRLQAVRWAVVGR